MREVERLWYNGYGAVSYTHLLKTVLGIVLGIVIALITPILAVIAVFNGGIKLDTEKLQQMITENLSAADQAMLQQVEDTMYAIEDEMTAAGFTGRIMEAQVLYILALEDHAGEPGFVSKLVGCFTAEQTDEQLIAAVNAAFGTEPVSYTHLLDDSSPAEREIGMAAGLSLLWFCDEIWVFGNTVTDGMKGEINFCKNLNIRIRYVTEAEIRAKMGGKTA